MPVLMDNLVYEKGANFSAHKSRLSVPRVKSPQLDPTMTKELKKFLMSLDANADEKLVKPLAAFIKELPEKESFPEANTDEDDSFLKYDIDPITDNMNPYAYLNHMLEKLKKKVKYWNKLSLKFKWINLFVTIFVICLQLLQVALVYIPGIKDTSAQNTLTTIFPAVTAAVLALQLKLGWTTNKSKSEKNAKIYKNLIEKIEGHKKKADDSGYTVSNQDAIKFCNLVLLTEIETVSEIIFCCKTTYDKETKGNTSNV